ncbi:hypothetical protein F4561_001908 [Lipingzhangella halophila]|uniref:Uncharacterized protein n=1 Tax=Lipingzhangella halophila TaxID=1783352 RepID=A0A7W7RG80_9ACTN|nr:hypothetical protein [Lipingzhangella halophila]MBB4931088.1 hypothetical protein [Lipingzhangella halophila]
MRHSSKAGPSGVPRRALLRGLADGPTVLTRAGIQLPDLNPAQAVLLHARAA